MANTGDTASGTSAEQSDGADKGSAALKERWRDFFTALGTPPIVLALIILVLGGGVYGCIADHYAIPAIPPLDAKLETATDATKLAAADAYCRDVSTHASALGNLHSVIAALLGILVLLAGLVQATEDGNGSAARRLRRPLLFASAPAALIAVLLFQRADAADHLASVANNARAGDLDPPTMLSVCTKAWGTWVLSRRDGTAIAKTAIEESVQGKSNALEKAVQEKVSSVTNKTASSVAESSKATADATEAVKKVADALLSKDPDAGAELASAKELAANAAVGAKVAASKAADAKAEAANPIAGPRAPSRSTTGPVDAGH